MLGRRRERRPNIKLILGQHWDITIIDIRGTPVETTPNKA